MHASGGRALCPIVQYASDSQTLDVAVPSTALPPEWVTDIVANEGQMLWTHGLIELPDCRLVDGPESYVVSGVLANGWPIVIQPQQKVFLGVHPTCQ